MENDFSYSYCISMANECLEKVWELLEVGAIRRAKYWHESYCHWMEISRYWMRGNKNA